MRWRGGLVAILLLVHILLYLFLKSSSLALVGNTFQGVILLMAAIQFTLAARIANKEAIVVRNLLALSFWIWFSSHALLAYSELLLLQPATGSVTDAIWLIGYFLLARALFMLLSHRITLTIKRLIFQLLILFAIVCAALWRALAGRGMSVMILSIQIIFPLLDFLIALLAFQIASATCDSRWLLGAIGSFIIGVADLIFPYFDDLASPMYRYLDVPLFVGYAFWWLQGAALTKEEGPSTIRLSL